MYLNKAFLFGNLTKDPELKSLPSGIKVTSFGMATNRTYKDATGNKKEQAEFHNIVAFGKPAELIAQYLKKGRSVFVEGRIQTRSWDDQAGVKKYRTEVVVENFQFGPSAPGAGGSNFTATPSTSASPSKKAETLDTIEYPSEDINPEDIPF
ncbi:MAG: single-stranded DNA-binding protein [Minisyncoccia bacterium]